MPLLDALKSRQARRDELIAEIAAADSANYTRVDVKTIARHVRARLAEWRELVTSGKSDKGREFMRRAMVGPWKLTPRGKEYVFEGSVAIARLVAGKG